MAQKESLKDLQARLAERLKLAHATGESAAWLAVTAGRGNYLLPLRQSGEIFSIPQWHVVPHTQPWFLGVMAIRGTLFGTVDLARFIAHAIGAGVDSLDDLQSLGDETPSVITINPAIEVGCALQVGRLSGLRSGQAFVSSRDATAGAPSFFGSQFVDAQGKTWQEINLQTLSQSPQFLNISA
ncbi:MAG: chemotaxis protein CheW [Rhodoferax sp.]|nr:chemotaxis protein CheW [Rhodoferax sp.]